MTTTLAATDAHPSKVSAQCGEGGGPATTGRGPERSLSQQALNLRSGTSEARSHAVVVAMGLAVEVYIAGAEHGARHVILTDIIRDKVSSRVRSEMGSHLALFEAGLHYLAERYSGTVELLNARGNLKDEGAAYAGKATELVVSSLCTLLEGGSLWGLNVGEWEFSPEQMQRIHAAARSASCKLCFAFFDAVLVGDEAARVLREDVIRPRRRGTTAAPWLYGDDPEWNAVIGAEDKMWFNPHDLRRNKQLKSALEAALEVEVEVEVEVEEELIGEPSKNHHYHHHHHHHHHHPTSTPPHQKPNPTPPHPSPTPTLFAYHHRLHK